ncbi:Uncharacterized membrane-anchored protein YitT, contains DUF161 and DUF2179 domains [Granulicatella balaenopterae]|uniref:Uncharacterized membrane-anchored protein YitT, contains DUF161 and DUF2179 domains n=1 Tax=Granulicatella balaenopterae TaxID=137733 RepID=A0A1H9K6G1_9LACT|nr:YitT family protein [Granulicatella balaenopterae]SEQ94710.1 Uncharacterized membrane-anchored protein YitT, contains DUF161 and DUF2179 domains [Granulicatella balaenopterae]
MNILKSKDFYMSLALVLLGSFLYAFGVNSFVIPNSFGEGGVTGISLLLFYTIGVAPAVTNIIINGLLMIVGYRYLEKKTMGFTIIAVIFVSIFLNLTQGWYQFTPDSPVVAAVTAGVTSGIGLGIVMLGNGTTAGADIIAMVAKHYFGWKVSFSMLLMNIIVLTPLSYIIGFEKGVITLMMLFISSQTLNFVLEGFNPKKAMIIISQEYEGIGNEIHRLVGRGTTIIHGTGFYSKADKHLLYVVVNRAQLMPVQRAIHELDPNAFVTIMDVNQVIGEGFTFYLDDNK